MSNIALVSPATGTATFSITTPSGTSTDRTLTLPDNSGTVLTSASNLVGVTGVGKVLQVVSTDYTSTFSSASTTPVDVSGFSATITPSSASSKILVLVTVYFGFANDTYPYVLLLRNGTSVSVGTTATGSRINTFLSGTGTNSATTTYRMDAASKCILDSPNTTSAVLYKIQFASPYSGTGYINRQGTDDNAAYTQRPTSTITLMEIAA
jgi:hypothetical protein